MLSKTEKMIVDNSSQNDAIPRFLAVCTVGCLRSPTIMKVMYEYYSEPDKKTNVNIRAAGIDIPFSIIPVTEKLIHWADYCICAERSHADIISNDWGFDGVIYNFSIPDIYEYADSRLEEIIRNRLDTLSQWEY